MDKKQYIGKFFGPDKIIDVFEDIDKTYLGNPYLNLLFEGNEGSKLLPQKVVDIGLTAEKSDFTSLQKTLFNKIIPELLAILADYDLTLFDTACLIQQMHTSIKENYGRAICKCLRADNEDKITLMQIERVLTK